MGNIFGYVGGSSGRSVFPGIPNLEVVRGPDHEGCYYIIDPTGSRIRLRFRFTANLWEWKVSECAWSSIPKELSSFNLHVTTATAIECLRDLNPNIAFDRHIQQIHLLSNGAFGQVYKVKFGLIMGHERFLPANASLAMKTIKSDLGISASSVWVELALENEMAMLREIQHPCVLRYYQCILYKEQIAMVTELCTGGTADDLRKRTKGLLPEVIILTMISHCIQALQFIHERRIIHRDIKPGNIFVSQDIHNNLIFKLGDFGFAKVRSSSMLLSNTGCVLFYSPEVIEAGFSSLPAMSDKSDIWALGVTIYFMCTNSYPYIVKNMNSEFQSRAPFPRINNVVGAQAFSSDVQAFLDACLQKDWKMRLSAADLFHTFQHIIEKYPAHAYC